MTGHQGFVLGVAFSPADDRLYSCSVEGDIHVWDSARRVRLEVWPRCHEGPIAALAVSSDGEVVSGGLDGTIACWSATGELERRLTGHDAGVQSVVLGETHIVSASADRRLGIWQRSTGELVRYLEGHEEAVTAVAFLDQHTLLSGSRDCTVRLWDLTGGKPPIIFEGHDWWVTRVAPVAGGRFVSVSEDCTLRLWDPGEQASLWVYAESEEPIWGLGVAPDGERVALSHGAEAYAIDLEARRAERLPKVAPVSARAICFSSNGRLLALGSDHGDVDLLDLSAGDGSGKLVGNGYPVLSGIVRPGLLATGRVSGAVQSVSASGAVTEHHGHDFFSYCARQVGEELFASGGFDQQVRLWRPGEAAQLASAAHGGLVFSLALDSTGQRLLAGGLDRISLFSLPGLELLWHLEAAGLGDHLVAAFAAGDRVAAVGEAQIMKIWADGQELARHPLPDAHNCVIEAVPGESRVVVGSAYGRLCLVDVDSGKVEPLHGEHEDWIRVLRVSADGQRIFSVSQNGSARLYDRSAGRVVDRFGHRAIAIGDFDESGRLHWLDCLGAVHSESAPA